VTRVHASSQMAPLLCLSDVACGHSRIHGTWHLSVIEAMFLTNQISELNKQRYRILWLIVTDLLHTYCCYSALSLQWGELHY